MATTPTYSWPIPDDTDLVKDGAEAIRDLGNAIDTTVDGLGSGGLVHIETESFSAVSGVPLNDVFSSTYDNYRIVYKITPSTTALISVRMRASGSDNSSSIYFRSGVANNMLGSTLSALNVNAGNLFTLFEGTVSSEPFYAGILEVSQPFLNTRTIFNFHTPSRVSLQIGTHIGSGLHNVSAVFDGINFLAASGTITGEIRVYGYQN